MTSVSVLARAHCSRSASHTVVVPAGRYSTIPRYEGGALYVVHVLKSAADARLTGSLRGSSVQRYLPTAKHAW